MGSDVVDCARTSPVSKQSWDGGESTLNGFETKNEGKY